MKTSSSLLGVALGLVLTACVSSAQSPEAKVPPAATPAPPAAPSPAANVFMQPSTLAYEMPPFDKITNESYRPAFEAGMAEQRAQIAKGASDPAAPSFENTIEAREGAGRILDRVANVFFNLQGAN